MIVQQNSYNNYMHKKRIKVSGHKFSTNEPIRNLFKDEQAKNTNETTVETLERMDTNISKTEQDLKSSYRF